MKNDDELDPLAPPRENDDDLDPLPPHATNDDDLDPLPPHAKNDDDLDPLPPHAKNDDEPDPLPPPREERRRVRSRLRNARPHVRSPHVRSVCAGSGWLGVGVRPREDRHSSLPGEPHRELEAKIAEELGKPVTVRRTYEFTPEGEAWVKRRVAEVQREARTAGETITEGEALARICKGASEDASARSGSPTNRVVIHVCECGEKASIETRDGPVAVSKETLEQALCDAEIVDTRGGPKRITKTIPEKTRRHVIERDRGRCTVPGCKNMGHIHVHHEGGRLNVGHDPEHMTTLCTAHHPRRHREKFAIEGTRSVGFRVVLPDGQEVKAPSRGEPARTEETSAVADMQLAKAALMSLEFPARRAGELVSRAREELEARGEACSVEALVRLALERS